MKREGEQEIKTEGEEEPEVPWRKEGDFSAPSEAGSPHSAGARTEQILWGTCWCSEKDQACMQRAGFEN